MRRVLAIYEDIERRTRATTEAHAWWPCRRGCGGCCRRLADVPRLTPEEWEVLREGIAALAFEVRARVMDRIAALRELSARDALPRHVECPMLEPGDTGDPEQGYCLVYAHRPAACRTYGFYARREDSLCCDLVLDAVASHGAEHDVVWGNHESVEHALERASGPARPLTEWALDDERAV
jgi:Fe-S-cluster containining protein